MEILFLNFFSLFELLKEKMDFINIFAFFLAQFDTSALYGKEKEMKGDIIP